jgi:hypothetical protein
MIKMPVKVKKFGKQWCTVEVATGKKPTNKGRCHATRQQAVKQTQAINISLLRQQGKNISPSKKK